MLENGPIGIVSRSADVMANGLPSVIVTRNAEPTSELP